MFLVNFFLFWLIPGWIGSWSMMCRWSGVIYTPNRRFFIPPECPTPLELIGWAFLGITGWVILLFSLGQAMYYSEWANRPICDLRKKKCQ